MLELPYDLQIQILRFLERRGLWSLSQTCQHLRQVATAELLSQYDIPKSQIESGSISLTEDAAFLIPAIHRFHPIHTITIFPRRDCSYPSNVSLERVPAILASLSPKPETVIRADAVFNEPTQHVDQLLNTYSRQGRDPIAIVDSGKIWVSSARVRPPLQKSLLHYNFTRHLREGEGVFSFITALPMMIFWTAIQLINAFRALFWLSCGWSQTVRISEDIQSHSGHSLSVKTLLTDQDSQFTLATFNHDSTQFSALSFPALPSLSCQQTSALLAALSLPHVAQLTVEEGSALDLGALLEFMQRHSSLTRLTLEHHAIGSTSFSTSLTTQSVGGITKLRCPAVYIPHILPTQPNITHLTIPIAIDEHSENLSSALDYIAAPSSAANTNVSPNIHHLTLIISTREHALCKRSSLPWHSRRLPDAETPVASLLSISHLALRIISLGSHRRLTGEICKHSLRGSHGNSQDWKCWSSAGGWNFLPISEEYLRGRLTLRYGGRGGVGLNGEA